MPANSIDTFFACILIIMVVIMSMVFTTNLVSPHLNALEGVNEEEYLRKIVDHAIVNCGSPANWGENPSIIPESFGLGKDGSFSYELDLDKVSRLNTQNVYSLSYLEMLRSLRLQNVALNFVFSQILDVSIVLDSSVTVGASTTYAFNISVSQNQAPNAANLKCYLIANNFLDETTSSISINDQGTVEFEVPNDSNGPAMLVVFARSTDDNRLTSQGVYCFGHLSPEPAVNNSFLGLSPLNQTLYVHLNVSEVSLESVYSFSYGYKTELSAFSNETYSVPRFLGSSPQVLVVTGWNGSDFFIEYTTYPQVPLEIGSRFEGAECFSFSYVVTINHVLYKLTVKSGGPSF
ncbi:MAG: hypothetical protein NUK63_02730 [Candidatus Bathyarchaeum tardum]|nr:MAG: hypothetical protein NUK63_02730 [Candidatus Bathyarchaeum tardum]